jgi:nucleotide-binding universal stress UspA family protein
LIRRLGRAAGPFTFPDEETGMKTRKILVGYDGSGQAAQAARWALDEAAATGESVEFCYSYSWPTYVAPPAGMAAGAVWPDEEDDRAAEALLEGVALKAGGTHPAVPVSTVLVRAPAASTLIQRSAGAALVVLGGRDHSAIGGWLLSVSADVAAHARCAVVVVHGTVRTEGPVVVGIEDSERGEDALAFAFEHAAQRGATVQAVRGGLSAADASGGHAVAELVERWQAKYPAVPVRLDLRPGALTDALLDASAGAQLVVVAARAHGHLPGSPLGSLTRHLLRHADCPVAVVR